MASTASGEILNNQLQTDTPKVGPELLDDAPKDPGANSQHTARSRKGVLFAVLGVFVILVLGLLTAYFLVYRGTDNEGTQAGSENEWMEYANPLGFAFDYPSTLQLVPTDEGVRLAGETEINFLVKPMEEPLENTVSEVAENFGIDRSTPEFSIQTVNSRTGFALVYEGKEYQYFPLFGEYYLEVVSDELNQTAMEVMNTLEFTPPTAQLN